jgi:hypothetical protein
MWPTVDCCSLCWVIWTLPLGRVVTLTVIDSIVSSIPKPLVIVKKHTSYRTTHTWATPPASGPWRATYVHTTRSRRSGSQMQIAESTSCVHRARHRPHEAMGQAEECAWILCVTTRVQFAHDVTTHVYRFRAHTTTPPAPAPLIQRWVFPWSP